ncbi:MAG: hypothetical protein AAGA27_06295, partial [Pseudomonadota bacterium]
MTYQEKNKLKKAIKDFIKLNPTDSLPKKQRHDTKNRKNSSELRFSKTPYLAALIFCYKFFKSKYATKIIFFNEDDFYKDKIEDIYSPVINLLVNNLKKIKSIPFILYGGHWRGGILSYSLTEQTVKVLFVDPVGNDADMEEANLYFLQYLKYAMVTKANVKKVKIYYSYEILQYTLIGCAIFSVDIVGNLMNINDYITDKNIFEYLEKNKIDKTFIKNHRKNRNETLDLPFKHSYVKNIPQEISYVKLPIYILKASQAKADSLEKTIQTRYKSNTSNSLELDLFTKNKNLNVSNYIS